MQMYSAPGLDYQHRNLHLKRSFVHSNNVTNLNYSPFGANVYVEHAFKFTFTLFLYMKYIILIQENNFAV